MCDLNTIESKLDTLQGVYDIQGFIKDLEYQLNQLIFYYKELTPRQTGDPRQTLYLPKKYPKPHTLGYFNLTRGLPKELHGGHWCYILKVYRSKALIIPTTSQKSDSKELNDGQIIISVNNFINGNTTRLQLGDIRSVDLQRLYVGKGFYDVDTDRDLIIDSLINNF